MSAGAKLFDAGVRVERVIWLPGAACADTPPEDLKDFLEDTEEDPSHYIYTVVPELKRMAEQPLDIELSMELLALAIGFLVQGAAPVRSYDADGQSYLSGWGHYRTRWFRAETMDAAADAIIAWAEEHVAADMAKAKARSAA